MKCYVHLGKHGDLIILMPGWLREYQITGVKPVVMVSKEFASTLEGISYVEPWVVPLHWYGDCGDARKMAEAKYGKENVVFPKWWDDPTYTPPKIRKDATKLIVHDKQMHIESGEWFSYMASQWKFAGFDQNELMLCPSFDRRNPQRELEQINFYLKAKRDKPLLFMCLNTGGSSPFPFVPEVERIVYANRNYHVINLMDIRAHYLFDLLGFFQIPGSKLITTDTAILHLAGASRIPYMAYIANGGGGSVPRGNCICSIRYHDTLKYLEFVQKYLDHKIQ